jgi:integrase
MAQWKKSNFRGVRYREHPTRKHGKIPDRYYTIFFKLEGKMVQEGLGWASHQWEEVGRDGKVKLVNWTEKRAAVVLGELRNNYRQGSGPRTLKEKREMQGRERVRAQSESMTLTDFWESDYIHNLKARMKQSSWEKEVDHFEKQMRSAIGDKPLKEITAQDVDRMLDRMREKGLSPRSQQYAKGTLGRIWKHAAQRKFVKAGDNPVAGVKIKQVNNARLRVISPEDLKNILDYLTVADPAAHDITLFAAFTGCRFSEAANLTWEHVDFIRNTALFPETKNRDAREVFLVEPVVDMLRRRGPGGTGEPVFVNSRGGAFNEPPSAFRTVVKLLKLNEGRGNRDRVCFHTLRHTAATLAARRGVPVKDLQLMLGWKTPSMVFRYVKGSEEVQRQAMRALAQSLTGEMGKVIPIIKRQAEKEA